MPTVELGCALACRLVCANFGIGTLDADLPGRKIMKFQRLLIVLTVLNLALLAFLLAQIEVRFLGFRFLLRSAEVNSAGSVLRGRGLEITDDAGRIRASIKLQPASVLPDGTT